MPKRYEEKFLCTEGQLVLVMHRSRGVMAPDPAGESYFVRSLYFDGPDDRCLAENEDGTEKKQKYRIRLYNGNSDFLRAEIKKKTGLVSEKFTAVITREKLLEMLAGKIEPGGEEDQVLREFALKIRAEGFRPATLCEYRRDALVGQPGRVRVTADRDLRATSDFERFLYADMGPAMPVFDLGTGLLEVKYTDILPRWIAQSAILPELQKTAFSKYRMCRESIQRR